MKIVFDTNIIHEDFHLQGPRISKLSSAANQLGIDLLVPEVVVDEMVNQYRKKLLQHFPGYSGLLKLVTKTQGSNYILEKDDFINEKTKEYESFLLKRIKALGILVISYPEVDIKTLVSKDLYVKKPFREIKEGNIGYRDALIWECIKSVCLPPKDIFEEAQVEFLTENTKDFAGTDNTLHPDLVEELKKVGFAENCVSLVTDVNAYFKTQIDNKLEELDNIKTALIKSGKYNRFDIMDEVSRVLSEEYVTDVLYESDYDSGEHKHIPYYMEEPSISNVNLPTINDVAVRRLSDHTVLIEVQSTVVINLEFFIYKSDYYLIDENNQPSIIDKDWNDHYMLCEGTLNVPFTLSFRTTSKLGKILSVDVQVDKFLQHL